jgi:5-methyltetrahydrofolate--homocysteine methyltransferase
MADLQGIADAVIAGQLETVIRLAKAAVDEGVAPEQIIDEGLIAGMNVVGAKFKANEFYVPEVLIAARAMHGGMDVVKPLLVESDVPSKGKVIIGTVKGDLHDIGKNLVAMMLEGGGYDVVDLAVDVSPQKYIETAQAEDANIIALSALLTTTMPGMKDTIDAIAAAGLAGKVKVIIGGAPVTQNYADEIGADGYAPDAASAVDLVAALL